MTHAQALELITRIADKTLRDGRTSPISFGVNRDAADLLRAAGGVIKTGLYEGRDGDPGHAIDWVTLDVGAVEISASWPSRGLTESERAHLDAEKTAGRATPSVNSASCYAPAGAEG